MSYIPPLDFFKRILKKIGAEGVNQFAQAFLSQEEYEDYAFETSSVARLDSLHRVAKKYAGTPAFVNACKKYNVLPLSQPHVVLIVAKDHEKNAVLQGFSRSGIP